MKAPNLAALLMGLGSTVPVPPGLDGVALGRKTMGREGHGIIRQGIPKLRPGRTAKAPTPNARRKIAKASRKRNRR